MSASSEEAQAWLDLDSAEVSYVFASASLPHFFFKGIFRDESLGLRSDRGTADIDVWVRRRDMGRAVRALQVRGYADQTAGWRLSEVGHSRTLRRGDGPEVDLHFTFPGITTPDYGWRALHSHVVHAVRAHRSLPTLDQVGHTCLLVLNGARYGEWAIFPSTQADRLSESHIRAARDLASALQADRTFELGLQLMFGSLGPEEQAPPDGSFAGADKLLRMRRTRTFGRLTLLWDEVVPSRAFMRSVANGPTHLALIRAYLKRWRSLPALLLRARRDTIDIGPS